MASKTITAAAAREHAPATAPASGQQMRAIVQRQYGTADVLVAGRGRPPRDRRRPTCWCRSAPPASTGARGTSMAGLPYAIRLAGFGLRAPKSAVPGLDVAGVVVAVGSDVTRFQPGDEVFGIGKGSFAEFAAAAEDKLALKPPSPHLRAGRRRPVSGLTALQGLCDVGRLQAGQRVLIIGASGGVGTYAVQIAKALGAEVTGVCSTAQGRPRPVARRRPRPRLHPRRLRRRQRRPTT